MFDSAILDVAIGLAFIFLLVSLLVTAAAEILAGWLKWRSRHLWDGLEHLLQSADARSELYNHPLIKGLTGVNVAAPTWAEGRNGPSYIPSRTFALALVDILRRPHKVVNDIEQRFQKAIEDAARDPSKIFASIEDIVRDMSGADVSDTIKKDLEELRSSLLPPIDAAIVNGLKQQVRALLDRMPEADRAVVALKISQWLERDADAATTYVELRATLAAAIGTLPFTGSLSAAEQLRGALSTALEEFAQARPEDAIREIQAFTKGRLKRWLEDASPSLQNTVTALSPLAHDAANEIDRFRENIEIWFNDGMDRVSGRYKRHTAFYQGLIALVLAVFMNVDALQIMRTLWREPTLRQSLVANAESLANTPRPSQPQDQAGDQGDDDTTNRLRLTNVRLFPEGVARATVTLPSDAGGLVLAKSDQGKIGFGATSNDMSAPQLRMTLPAGAKEAEFFVKAEPVREVTPEKVEVSWQALNSTDAQATPLASRALVVTPTADDEFAALQNQIGALGLPIGWSCPTDKAASGAVDLGTTIGGPFWCTVPPGNSGRRWLSASWLGITGWTGMSWASLGTLNLDMATAGDRLLMLVSMVLGWLITAAAASLGAPFWFDSLKRVISVRSSGKAPEERPLSPKEVSQPREPGQRPREADLLNALKR
jgi:hypothetical protein